MRERIVTIRGRAPHFDGCGECYSFERDTLAGVTLLDEERLARAIRAYIGYPRTPTRNEPTWYIDIDSSASDEEVHGLAEDLARAYREDSE